MKLYGRRTTGDCKPVAPFAGAWIEIFRYSALIADLLQSLPSRERGLKFQGADCKQHRAVAPFAGAWIEMLVAESDKLGEAVAPFAGAWIEITASAMLNIIDCVAPFAGAWIEMRFDPRRV